LKDAKRVKRQANFFDFQSFLLRLQLPTKWCHTCTLTHMHR
jgi:hypothetical protein